MLPLEAMIKCPLSCQFFIWTNVTRTKNQDKCPQDKCHQDKLFDNHLLKLGQMTPGQIPPSQPSSTVQLGHQKRLFPLVLSSGAECGNANYRITLYYLWRYVPCVWLMHSGYQTRDIPLRKENLWKATLLPTQSADDIDFSQMSSSFPQQCFCF